MGEALRPLLSKLKERADAPAVGEAAEPVTVEFLSQRLRELDRAIARLEAAVEAMMADVIAKEGADDTDVYRAVARLESRVDDFVDDCADLRCRTEGDFLEGARLLANVYDGLLGRIENWLEDLVESIVDPLAAVERKGLPTSGYVELPLKLNIDAPQRIAELQDWVDRELRRRDTGQVEGAVAIHLGREGPEEAVLARLKRIGGALRLTQTLVAEELKASVKPRWSALDIKSEMFPHLDRLQRFDGRLERVGECWSDVVSVAEVDEEEVDKVVVRIAGCADQMAAGYREVRSLNASGRLVRGRDLLALNYRQSLRQLEIWLSKTVEVLVDPLAECERRGLPARGRVHLLAELRPTVPPADRELAEWLEDMRLRGEEDAAFWNTAVAVGAGILIGGLFFDD